jgi:beta-glucanase (GH16 family)
MIEDMKNLLLIASLFGTPLLGGCSKDPEIVKPEIIANSVTVLEGKSAEVNANISITLSESIQEDILLGYSTEDLTAKSGKDYTGIEDGILTIPSGSTSATLSIPLLQDDLLEFTEIFRVIFVRPANATLRNERILVNIEDNDTFIPDKDSEGFITPETYPDLELVWAEEFGGPAIDPNAWTFELGNGCPDLCGWGNNELEYYTDEETNAKIVNGKLVITALKKEGYDEYTSARMITRGKKEFQYGRIDIRARLPYGQGIWPAIWMLGENIVKVGWPQCGEIDIMELVGDKPKVTHGTAHYDAGGYASKGSSYALTTGQIFADEFHVFSILWEKDHIIWYVDYIPFFELDIEMVGSTYPFNNLFFFILNVAVGGNWPGNPDGTTVFPQTMEVDYIRVFQQE